MKVVVFTLGCKVNECESDSLIQGFIDLGFTVSDKLEPADIYVINSCAVTKDAEKKSRQAVARALALNENAKIIFTGCASQKNPNEFLDKKGVAVITGTFGKQNILSLLDKSGVFVYQEPSVYEEMPCVKSLKSRAYVKVEDGCNNFCSYCVIPYLRGRVRSRNYDSVIKEITAINPSEAVINGINLSAYNFNGQGLTGLIKALKPIKNRIRLGSLEVGVINKEFLTALGELYDFAPHFHLSLQSGSDSVLKAMNRKYTTKEYLEKVNLIREYFPNAGITTDVIAGFPTESDKDFLDSVEFIKKVGFSDIHPFRFSKREGTVAYKMQDNTQAVKKQRMEVLLSTKKELKQKFIKSQIDKILSFLPEEFKNGYTEGYSENYLRIYVKDKVLSKQIFKVKIVGEIFDGALAEIID